MKKPIVFFDLETTGKSLNPDDVRIIEISAIKVDPDTLEEIDKCYYKCNNDGVPIQDGATERHSMVEADLVGYPPFRDVAKNVYDFFEGCDTGGYNSSVFDIPILFYSFLRSGLTWRYKDTKNYDVFNLYRKYHSNKLKDVYKRYTGKDLEDAHEADADVHATLDVYREQRKQNEEFDDEELDYFKNYLDISRNFVVQIDENGGRHIKMGFGKHKDKDVDEVDTSYFKWMVEAGNFPKDTVHYAKMIYEAKMKTGDK